MRIIKINYLIIILVSVLIYSCSTIKIKELELDQTQELIGKVKKIEVRTIHFGFGPLDPTKTVEENFIIYYDKQNRITKLTDKIFGETEYFYSNGLLDKTITKNKIGIYTT